MAEEADVKAVAIAVAMLQAEADESGLARGEGGLIDAFGHEKNSIGSDVRGDLCEEAMCLCEVIPAGDDEFELMRIGLNPLGKNSWPEAGGLMPGGPCGIIGGGVGELGTEGGEVAGNASGSDGAGRFDREVFSVAAEGVGEFVDARCDHGFPASEHAVA